MDIKTITLVIILSVLIGIGVFTAGKYFNHSPLASSTLTQQNQATLPQPSSNYPSIAPIAKPSQSPINEKTNLEEEINKLTVPDFSQDIQKLKMELTQ